MAKGKPTKADYEKYSAKSMKIVPMKGKAKTRAKKKS